MHHVSIILYHWHITATFAHICFCTHFKYVLVLIIYTDFYIFLVINYRLQYKGTPKSLGESVTAIGIGI